MPLIRVSEEMKEELEAEDGNNFDERIRNHDCKQDVNAQEVDYAYIQNMIEEAESNIIEAMRQ